MAIAHLLRRTVPAAILLWSAAAAIGCAARRDEKDATEPGESRADKHYDVAVGSFHNGMYADASLQLDKALATDPKHADSHYLRGVLLLNEGKTIVDAIEFEQCLVDDASLQQRSRAELLHRQAAESFERAVGFYKEGAAGRGRAFNSMSVVSLFFHDNQRAISSAESALGEQFYTDRYSALANLGWAHYHLGDLVSATASLRQAVLINPEYCVGHYRLAQVYLDTGLTESALEHAAKVMEAERCPIQDAYRIAGVARLRLGLDADAQQAFERCVEIAPRSCMAADCRKLLSPETPGETTVARGAPEAAGP
jgi:tetratricopeptide (TPR) repeat protein